MTKKDYELIARVFKIAIVDSRANEPEVTENYEQLAGFMAHKLGQENPKFDRNKFLQACDICDIRDNGRQNGNYDWLCVTHQFSMSYVSSEKPKACPEVQ